MKIVLIGPQGSGKGTQAKMLSKKYGVPHISVGEIFREAIASGSELGKKVKKIVESGKLVPDELVSSVVRERLSKDDCGSGFLLDGFPRTIGQAEALGTFAEPDSVLDIEIDDEATVKRLSGRWQCRACGAIYGAANPPKKKGRCDKDNEKLYQRDDDKPDAIRKRLAEYHTKTKPLTEFYRKKGTLMIIDGSLQIDKVFKDIISRLEKR